MPIYEYKGQQYELSETDPALAKSKIQSFLGETAAPQQPTEQAPAFGETGGGAATGMLRRGRSAKVQPTTPLEAVAGDVFKGAILNPALAATQVVGGQGGREFVAGIEKQQQAARKEAGLEGIAVGEIVGAGLSPINKLLPGGGYTGGAVGAITQPVSTENQTTLDVIQAKAVQLGTGAALGKVAENLIAGLTPTLKPGAQELMDQGVKVSPGQAFQGAPGWLFRQIESFGLGPKAEKINKQFNTVVANDVLSEIGDNLPKGVKPGTSAVSTVQNKISNFYDDSLAKLGKNAFDREYKDGVSDAIKATLADIPDQQTRDLVQRRLVNSLNTNIGGRVKNGQIDGEDIKKVQEWLKGEVKKYDGKTDVVATSLKTGYGDVLSSLNQYISRIDKDGNIAKADSAWAKLYSFADASKSASTQGGVFSPEQLAQAAARQAPTILAAGGGRGPLQATAETGVEVLGKQEPMNLLRGAMLASKAATGFATAYMAPAVAIPVLLGSGMAYGTAVGLLRSPEKLRVALQKSLQQNPGLFGSAGQQLLEQINKDITETQQ
jgi:hypothetical protein